MIKKSLSFPDYTTMTILLPIFVKKRKFLTPFSAEQCSILHNSSKRPTNLAPRVESCFVKEEFSYQWKKANVVPVHKKSDKQSLQTDLIAANLRKKF